MNELVAISPSLPAMSINAIAKVAQLEAISLTMPQVDIETRHVLHGGMYARSIMIPADTILTGALIKIPTILIISGDITVFIGDETLELHGYNVLPASAGRKQAFVAHTDTEMTMLFPCDAKTVEEAEKMFTDDADSLMSRHMKNQIIITGENK